MENQQDMLRDKAYSAFRQLAREFPAFQDAQMLVGGSEAEVSLEKRETLCSIDLSWIEAIEAGLPYLDTVIRSPSVAIEDVDEILPLELSRHITDKSIKHLATHTNLILDIQGEDVTPQKILNVYHDETYLTYENKFLNTLLSRLVAFVDKRCQVLRKLGGAQTKYTFHYSTQFSHREELGASNACVTLEIELATPAQGEEDRIREMNLRFREIMERVERIHRALLGYQGSAFAQKLGRNYIRPPVIRTNAILKNKDLKECLVLWEFLEGFDKAGYTQQGQKELQMPAQNFASDLYSTVALQYLSLYTALGQGSKILASRQLPEQTPQFQSGFQDQEEYSVYDSEYRKMVSVSRLANSRRKLSEDEKRIGEAIAVALKADEMIRQEAERRRLAEEKLAQQRWELEQQRLREEAQRRLAEEQARLAREQRLREEAQRREEERLAWEAHLAEEAFLAQQARLAAEAEAERLAAIAQREEARKAEVLRKQELAARHKKGRQEESYRSKNNEKVRRKAKEPAADYVFLGEESHGCPVVVPYTRQAYSNLPRKKKKQVLAQAYRAAGLERK